MNARKAVIAFVATITLAASGGYLFVYLYRWEWNRALISGVIFLAAEMAVIGWALNTKLTDLSHQMDANRAPRIAAHLDTARRDEPSHAFDWLRESTTRTNVFIPILLSAGLVLSGLAWLVEKLGKATAGRSSDHRLATNLSRLAPPPGGFLDDRNDPLRDLRGPAGGRW